MHDTSVSSPAARWLAPGALLLGSAGLAILWILLSLYLGRPCSWMSVVSAVGASLLLRFAGVRARNTRMAGAVLATLSIIVLANWGIAAAQIGFAMGLNPWDSALKLGMDYAWTLAGLANRGADLAWMAVALAVAILAAR